MRIDINFDALLGIETFMSEIAQRLQNQTRLWMDFVAPFTFDEVDAIFETEGYGQWSGLDPLYAARKAVTHPGQPILRRDGNYMEAATSLGHPGNIAEFGATEMVLGVSGDYFESTDGENYPALHEVGNDEQNLSARPVYELIAAGERFEERISQLGEKWQREEIAILERSI